MSVLFHALIRQHDWHGKDIMWMRRGWEERRFRASGCSVSRQYSWSICLPLLQRQPAATTTRWQTPLPQKHFLCPSSFLLPLLFPPLCPCPYRSLALCLTACSTSSFTSLSPSALFSISPSFSVSSTHPSLFSPPHSLCVSQALAQKITIIVQLSHDASHRHLH